MKKSLFMLAILTTFGWQANSQNGGNTCAEAVTAEPGIYSDAAIVPETGGATQGSATDALWYVYTPETDGTININSCISDPESVDTRLWVYTDGCETLTPVADDDDSCDGGSTDPNGFASSITDVAVVGGQEYLIEWDDRWDAGEFDWELTLTTYCFFTAPNNINIDTDPSSCVASNVDLGVPTITGVCPNTTISNNAPNTFPIGTTQVLWTLVYGNGLEITDTQTVTVTLQVDVVDICYVSSDQTQVTNNRVFITNDPTNNGLNVEYYEVLREAPSGDYQTIGFINPPEVSFLDTESNNTSQAYRYKIKTTDICGANYPESSFHKTILLQSGIASDNSINLSWTPYLGLDFSTYNIYKNTNGTGYELLTSLSFNNTTYNDTSANVEDNFYEYYISIEVASCGSDPLLPFNLRSNLELVNQNLSMNNNNWIDQEIQIYPNPTSDYINVSFPNQIVITTVSIYNTLGQLVFDTVEFENIYISNLSPGLYYLSIDTNKGVVKKTMIRK